MVRYIAYLQDWEAQVNEHHYEKVDIRGEFDKIYYKHKLVQWKEAWDDANNNYEKRRQLNIEKLDRLGFNMDLKKKIDGAFSEIRKAFAYFSKLNWGLTDKNIDNYFKTFIDPTLPLDIQKNSVKLLSSNVIVNVILKNHFININLGNNPMIDSRVFNRVANKFIIENMKTIFKVKFNKVFEERYGKSLWYDMIEEITSGDIIS